MPPSYDGSNQMLLVWMHGCGGEAEGDAYEISPGDDRSYIAISIGGREDDCWDPNSDVPKVLSAVADVKTHLNIDPRRVIIAGYSSGGDLAYRTIFYNADLFAGILAENTSPFRGRRLPPHRSRWPRRPGSSTTSTWLTCRTTPIRSAPSRTRSPKCRTPGSP